MNAASRATRKRSTWADEINTDEDVDEGEMLEVRPSAERSILLPHTPRAK